MKKGLFAAYIFLNLLIASLYAIAPGNVYKDKEKYSFINFGKAVFGRKLYSGILETASRVNSETDCQMKCVQHEKCISYNYGPSKSGSGCVLSSDDRFSKRKDFKVATEWVHRGVKSNCEVESYCGTNMLCIPDHDTNTARCKKPFWEPLPGRMTQIDAGATGALWGVNTPNILKLSNDGKSWDNVPGGLKHVSVGEGGAWGISLDHQIWYREGSLNNSLGSIWVKIIGGLKQIDSGKLGVVFGVNIHGSCFFRDGISSTNPKGLSWLDHSNGFNYVSCGAFGCWGIKKDVSVENVWFLKIYFGNILKLAGTSWVPVSGISLVQIEAGPDGAVWGVTSSSDVFYRAHVTVEVPTGTDWVRVNGSMKHVTVGCLGVFGVDTQQRVYRYYGQEFGMMPCS